MTVRPFTLAALSLTALLAACSPAHPVAAAPTPPVVTSPTTPVSLGRMEVSFTGIGTQLYATSVRPLGSGLQGQALTTVAQGLQLRFNSKGSFDVGTPATGGMRYLSATYDVRNAGTDAVASSTARSNLTFVAVDAATPATLSGTAIRNFQRADGLDADPALAPKVIPTVGMTLVNGTPTVNASQADFQAFSTDEISALGLPSGARDVFQYGFVVRNRAGTSRTLPANPGANQYDGLITFAVKLPLQATSANNPFSFSLVFEVYADSSNRVTRVAEETASAAQSRAATLGASLVDGETICRVRTAGSAAAPLTVLTGLGVSAAVPGTLDLCFGTNGTTLTDFGSSQTRGVVVQPDGRIVVAAHTNAGVNADNEFGLLRYTPDGLLDTTFGTGGKVVTAVTPGNDQVAAISRQSDGKLVVFGSSQISGSATGIDFAVARYNADGTLDQSFGATSTVKGTVQVPVVDAAVARTADTPSALAIQSDGKLLLVGYTSPSGTNTDTNVAVVRLNTDGSLDTTFNASGNNTTANPGSPGRLILAIGTNNSLDVGNAVQVQSDGKIVLSGYTYDYQAATLTNDDMFIARLNANGSLDTSFAGTGKVIRAAVSGNVSDRATALRIQPDGKYVVAGTLGTRSDSPTSNDIVFARFTSQGALDTSFATGGIGTYIPGSGVDSVQAMQLQSDNKIVLAGSSNNGAATGTDMTLIRLTTAGALDTSFASSSDKPGVLRVPISTGSDTAYALQIQDDGKLVAAGNAASSTRVGLFRAKP